MLNFLNSKKVLRYASILIVLVALFVILYPEATHAEKLYQVLEGTSGPSITIKSVWKAILDLINYAGIGLLIFIAFANILRLNINTYGIKKFLPTLVLAIIAANFSYLICRLMIDLANVVMDALISGPTGAGTEIGSGQIGIAKTFKSATVDDAMNAMVNQADGSFNSGAFWKVLVLIIAEFIGSILMLILAFLFFIRNYVIYFLVIVSPLAFIATVLPQTKSLFNQWWSNFWKWAFLPVVSLFWLWVGSKFIDTFTDYVGLLAILFAMVCYYMAIVSPFKLGGGIMTAWKGVGQKAWGATGGKVTGAVKTGAEARIKRTKLNMASRALGWKIKTGTDADGNDKTVMPLAWIERHGASQRFKNQQAEDVRDKSRENAEKEIYHKAYADHVSEKKILDGASLSRVVARRRKWISEDQEGVRFGDAKMLQARLKKMGFLYEDGHTNEGQLKTEAELVNLSASDLSEGKAILKELREQTRKAGTKGIATPVWEEIIPNEENRRLAGGNDIAGNLYRNIGGVSAVGEIVDETRVTEQMTSATRDKRISTHLVNLASQTGIDFEDAIKRAGLDRSNLSPEALASTQNLFDHIRQSRDNMIAEEMKSAEKQIENEMVGTKLAFDSRTTDPDFKQLSANINSGQKALNRGSKDDIAEAESIARSSGFTAIGLKEDALKESLQKFYTNANSGMKQVSADLKSSMINQNSEWNDYGETLNSQKLANAKAGAEANVTTQIAMRSASGSSSIPDNLTVGNLSDPKALQALDNIAKRIVEGNDGLSSAIEHLGNKEQARVKSNLGKEIQGALKDGLSKAKVQGGSIDADAQAMALKTALKDAGTTKALSKSIALGMEKTIKSIPKPSSTTNATKVTNVTGTTASPPNPVDRPDSNIGKPKL